MKYSYDLQRNIIGTIKDKPITRPTTQEDYEFIKRLNTPLTEQEYNEKYGN